MGHCDRYRMEAQLYFDNELKAQDLEDFRMHLSECPVCQDYLRQATETSEILHSARPLFSASNELVQRVKKITGQSRAFPEISARPRTHVLHSLRQALHVVDLSAFKWRASAASILFVAIALTLFPTWIWHVGAASYADAALRAHDSYLTGNLPPEVLSSSPEVVTAWFAGKLPFNFRLPASRDQQVYRLIGGRLIKYRGNDAALVVYDMKASKISLMVTSEKSAVATGGDEVQSEGLTFHYHVKNGMNIITWTTHGLTYALVSSIQGSSQSSCLVCHQNMADKNRFQEPH
jgi:anti-sigma factor RsiW